MSEQPRTRAGRALVDALDDPTRRLYWSDFRPSLEDRILAIEAEAATQPIKDRNALSVLLDYAQAEAGALDVARLAEALRTDSGIGEVVEDVDAFAADLAYRYVYLTGQPQPAPSQDS